MIRKRNFWITLALFNLAIVAFLGFGLRSKILFSLPGIDFRNLESSHSHFAFAGWAGLGLMTLMIFDILPEKYSCRNIYRWILTAIEVSALGMAVVFPMYGYNPVSICFSTLYIIAAIVFAPVFITDLIRSKVNKQITLLGITAVISLVISFLGTLGLIYILSGRSSNSLLYRDSIYTFLHFQYNGFFTVSIFALLYNHLSKKGILLNKHARLCALFLCLSVIPALFLSLLWHNSVLYYMIASAGCLFIICTVYYFIRFFAAVRKAQLFTSPFAKTLWLFSMISFVLKMLLSAGTIIPSLGNAVYGDRPIIIGFLHLVFLGLLSFFMLAEYIEKDIFTKNGKVISFPLILFSIGIFANELILMVQGFGILFMTNNEIFKWLLWVAAIILFAGALLMIIVRLSIPEIKKT